MAPLLRIGAGGSLACTSVCGPRPTVAARLAASTGHRARTIARAEGQPTSSSSSSSSSQDGADKVPFGCSRFTVKLKRPLGIVLEQDSKNGNIYVVEVKRDGSAARDGSVSVGDQLIATSGVVYTSETEYNGAMVKGGQQTVRLMVVGESFKAVSAAIGSHPGHMPVTLEFQKCDPALPGSGK